MDILHRRLQHGAARHRGFTLAELMVVLAIIALTIAMGSPALAELLSEHRLRDARHRLVTSLALARIAAIREGRPVTVCPSHDGRHCSANGVWDEGWLVFRDPDRKGEPLEADAVIEQTLLQHRNIRLRSSPHRSKVRFSPKGWSAGHNLTVNLCAPSGELRAAIIVNNAGRARAKRAPAGTPCPR